MQRIIRRKGRRGFTMVELLAVICIILILGGVMLAIRPGNPQGLGSATRSAIAAFDRARFQAQNNYNPDRDAETNKLYNIRSRVLILNDSANPDEHLRLLRVVVGGTRNQNTTSTSSYIWYALENDVVLPSGVYYVEPTDSFFPATRRSRITNRDTANKTMRLDYAPTVEGQADGSGDKEWYFYEFNNDGTTNMYAASFMISEGDWDPSAKAVVFRNKDNIDGFAIVPNGTTIKYSDAEELDKANQ